MYETRRAGASALLRGSVDEHDQKAIRAVPSWRSMDQKAIPYFLPGLTIRAFM